jgi:hypothetical protein
VFYLEPEQVSEFRASSWTRLNRSGYKNLRTIAGGWDRTVNRSKGCLKTIINFTFLLALIFTCSVGAMAQRNEIAGTVGGSLSTSSVLDPGASLAYGAQYDGRLLHSPAASLYVDVPFVVVSKSSFIEPITCALLSQCQNSYNSYFFTPGVKVNLAPSFFLSPYAVAGIGLAHYHTIDIPILGSSSVNHVAFEVGGGLDVKVFPHVMLRGEVRDFISTTPDLANVITNFTGGSLGKQNNIIPQAGLVFTF